MNAQRNCNQWNSRSSKQPRLSRSKTRMTLNRNKLSFAALLALGALVLAGCGSKNAAPASAAGPPAMPVTLQTVRLADIQESSEYVATLKSRRSSNISPQVDGQITRIFVKSGDHVTAGTPLMQIDPLKQQA